jgi:hypothetical protein
VASNGVKEEEKEEEEKEHSGWWVRIKGVLFG